MILSNIEKKQEGQILIFAAIMTLIVTAAVGSLVGYTRLSIQSHRQALNREVGLNIAEAGLELAVWKLNNEAGYTGETNTVYGNGVYTVTVTNLNSSSRQIKVDSYVPNATNPIAHRTIQLTAVTGSINVGFNYGVQVGGGGLRMENSSTVIGNVYSSGKVWGGGGSGSITGDVLVSGTDEIDDPPNITGNARAHKISSVGIGGTATSTTAINATNVGGVARADTYLNSNITGDLYYKTSKVNTTVGGTTYPNTTPPVDLPDIPFPILDDQIEDWETAAAAGGDYTGSCTISSGTVNLGPKKLNCDLIISNTAIVNVTGPLWIAGNLTVQNSAKLRVDASYGSGSEVVVVDNPSNRTTSSKIIVANSAQVLGSGTAESYMMLVSQNNSAELGGNEVAINPKNSTIGQIYYAPHGRVKIENAPILKEVGAYIIHMTNSSTLTYETGLGSTEFSSGPSGGWEVGSQTWQLLQ